MTSRFRDELHAWRSSRFGLCAFHFAALFISFFAVRVILAAFFRPPAGVWDYAKMFLVGGHLDLVVAFFFILPLTVWCLICPEKYFRARWHQNLLRAGLGWFWLVQIFLLFTEFYFFDEFKSRFNTVAVDYLLYPHEVFGNIWQSYPLVRVVLLCLAAAAAVVYAGERLARSTFLMPLGARVRRRGLAAVMTAAVLLFFSASFQESQVSRERLVNEIANNGAISFLSAAWTRNLDYGAFYPRISRDEAFRRTRLLLREADSAFEGGVDSVQRTVRGQSDLPKLNVVILLEESLGSEFWGSLGRKEPTLTPRMDQLARTDGILFENIYATGNRTVRGFEGVLSSFPPLPGDSIVKRDRSTNVETIARVLKREDYETVFLYGGRGLFDGMRAFAVHNGYDRFVEQKDFPHPTFTTAWGVCNEDLYHRTLVELRALAARGKPFLATVLSVSNHRPYTFPAGRIAEDPNKHWRDYAVKYTDWALGQFFEAVKKESFYTNTVFVVVADHGARVYGSQSIPIHSYEIPFLVVGPAVVKAPARIATLGSQLDVAPTILSLVGRPYRSMFYGRDLFKISPDAGQVFINHNRDIGMFRGDRMVVLAMNKRVEFYRGNPKTGSLSRNETPDTVDRELEKDAIAVFQTADELYMSRTYRIDLNRRSDFSFQDKRGPSGQ